MENKSPSKKIPWWGWVIGLIVGSMLLGSFFPVSDENKEIDSNQRQQELAAKEDERKAEKERLDKRVAPLRADLTDYLNESVGNGNMFTKSHLEHITDNHFKLELTVTDDWYYLQEFQQERLLEDAWQFFNMLGVKHSLRKENEMPWEVVFIDRYKKKVAENGFD